MNEANGSGTELPRPERIERWLARHGAYAAVGLCLLAAALAGAVQGAALAILVLAAGALVAAIAAFWSSLRALFGDRPMSADEAFAFAGPTGEDEQKRAVLRALQDLDYERDVGKISEDDYARLRDRYRAEASRLLELKQQADEPLRRRVEQLVAEHLAREEAAGVDDEDDEADDELDLHVCAECGLRNDEDAVFCKKCGHRLGDEAADEDELPEESESEP